MNIPDYRVEPADYHADFNDLRAIREEVFIVEQNIPEAIEIDLEDPDCFHVIARDKLHQAIGTARISSDHKIARMAVLKDWRKKGVGKSLLIALIEKARKSGWTEVTLNAQTDVILIYEKLGFTRDGEVFLVANIPHQTMRLQIEPLVSSRPVQKSREPLIEISELDGLENTLTALKQLISKARRLISIYSPDLEPVVYGQAEIIESLKQFAINSAGGNVQIIVQDPLSLRSQAHPLIDLAQRLPSVFFLRTPVEPDDLEYPSAYLVNDRDGYLFRQQSSQYQGVWSPALPSRNRQLAEHFDRVWQRCRPCTEFRVLGL
jgi:predicted GNAT family N-acyltransferase